MNKSHRVSQLGDTQLDCGIMWNFGILQGNRRLLEVGNEDLEGN